MRCFVLVSLLGCLGLLGVCSAWKPRFFRGRPRGGFVPPPERNESRYMHVTPVSPDLWFEQTLNHFDSADTRTFKQRYFLNNKFYKTGGPVFLMIGGEGPASPVWMENAAWVDYAKTHKAMMFLVEHRYYGKTHPTVDMTVENLQYLSSEQALADLAHFINFANDKYKLAKNKWIAFGGSYSGALAAWFRLKFPHLVVGAVATSAPMVAALDFKEYLHMVVIALKTVSAQCVTDIAEGVTEMGKMIATPKGLESLKTMFRLCEAINATNSEDISNLYETLASNFEYIVQYNKDNRAFEGAMGTKITIDTLCGIMTKNTSRSAVQRYADVNNLMLDTFKEKCQDFSYKGLVEDMKKVDWNNDSAGRLWTYQTCTEFGYFQTSELHGLPFGQKFPLSFFIKQCQDIFGSKFSTSLINGGILRTNTNYGGYQIKATNVVLPNGSVDPWHALGIVKTLNPGATALFIEGTAHCANMYPPTTADPADLVKARTTISNLIGKWLA